MPAVLASIAQQATDSFSVRVAAMDASGDPAVAASFDAAGDLIAYRRTGQDGGQAEAIDAAWKHVPADILHWLNDDDFLAPGALGRVHGMFAADMDLDVVYGQTAMLDADEAFVGLHHAFDAPSDRLLR